mgnify:CR=1 FL=1
MKIGEKCVVVMSRNDVFEWQLSPRFEAILTHVPQDVGDCFYFKVGNRVVVINPLSADFVSVEQEQK